MSVTPIGNSSQLPIQPSASGQNNWQAILRLGVGHSRSQCERVAAAAAVRSEPQLDRPIPGRLRVDAGAVDLDRAHAGRLVRVRGAAATDRHQHRESDSRRRRPSPSPPRRRWWRDEHAAIDGMDSTLLSTLDGTGTTSSTDPLIAALTGSSSSTSETPTGTDQTQTSTGFETLA